MSNALYFKNHVRVFNIAKFLFWIILTFNNGSEKEHSVFFFLKFKLYLKINGSSVQVIVDNRVSL
jgi:hypothetical protein